jgi:hypothetical protein
MNKKIRAVVKHYEKNMKFESKFEQLSHKLDLIKDDTPLKSDVIVIRRKLIPAYMMSVLVMALVTGLIGLQIGLGNLKIKTEYINPVKVELEKHVDHYLSQSIHSNLISDDLIINYYVGIRQSQKFLIVNLNTNQNYGTIILQYNQTQYTLNIQDDEFWAVILLEDEESYVLGINYTNQTNEVFISTENLDLNGYFEYIDIMFN